MLFWYYSPKLEFKSPRQFESLRTTVLESNLLEKWSVKLWLQLLVPVLVDNVGDFLFPADMWWTVGVTLQPLSSTNINYSLPHQKTLKTEGFKAMWITSQLGELSVLKWAIFYKLKLFIFPFAKLSLSPESGTELLQDKTARRNNDQEKRNRNLVWQPSPWPGVQTATFLLWHWKCANYSSTQTH